MFLPWKLKRIILIKWYNYEIHSSAKIGFSYIFPQKLIMKEGARISHFTVGVHLDLLKMGKNSTIGRNNWISGFSTKTNSEHFRWQQERLCEFILGDESAVTHKHRFDCTNFIHIGHHATIAGYGSEFLTHSIDVYENRQGSNPITIGDYTFVSTRVTVLGGGKLPSYSVLGAGAVLQKGFEEEWKLYAGVSARPIKSIPHSAKYFSRQNGFVI